MNSYCFQRSITNFPSMKNSKAFAAVVDDFPSCFGEKLSLGKASRLQRKKSAYVPPVLSSRYPHASEPKEKWEDYYFRPVVKRPWEAKKRRGFLMIDDEEDPAFLCEAVGTVDARPVIEAMNRKVDMDEIFFGGSEGLKSSSHMISYLNAQGHNLELVKAGAYESGRVVHISKLHHNFMTKKADDPSAPVETYFAELSHWDHITVECCVSLGESDSLPYKRDNRGCKYCSMFVHHPVGGCDGKTYGPEIWVGEENGFITEEGE